MNHSVVHNKASFKYNKTSIVSQEILRNLQMIPAVSSSPSNEIDPSLVSDNAFHEISQKSHHHMYRYLYTMLLITGVLHHIAKHTL